MNHEEATAILEKAGIKPGDSTAGLTGGKRAQVKAALNFLNANPSPEPAPKKKRTSRKKKTD